MSLLSCTPMLEAKQSHGSKSRKKNFLFYICIWYLLHGMRSKGRSCLQHVCIGQANPRIEVVARTEKILSLLFSKIRISSSQISLL